MAELSGTVALVTGASAGIGRYLAQGLAERGATVAGLARTADRLRATMDEVAELVGANERLRAVDKLRKEFYRNVSHELATPLTPIVGYLSMLLNDELGPLNKSQQKALRAVDDCTKRLRGQIDNLLDITGLETGRIRFVDKRTGFVFISPNRSSMKSLSAAVATGWVH